MVQNKGVFGGSPFYIDKGDSYLKTSKYASLDPQRAQSSRQHVRALNTAFARWVQEQHSNHQDELWEDGVKDYLVHASGIMEKFSDVVDWIKANSLKVNTGANSVKENTEVNSENNFVYEKSNTATKIGVDKIEFSSTGTSITTLRIPAGSGRNQPPVLFGAYTSFTGSIESGDANDETEDEKPSSPSLERTKEIGIIVVHEVKCKLYIKSRNPDDKDPWKNKGIGQLFIKCNEGVMKATKESNPTIIIRNDVGRILLNALLYNKIQTNSQKNSLVVIFHTMNEEGQVTPQTYLIRTKTEEERTKLAEAIEDYAPAS